jgi:hypothetical protein
VDHSLDPNRAALGTYPKMRRKSFVS